LGKIILAKGTARDERELFEFEITAFVASGFLLTISYSGDGRNNTTGAGVWPTVEKAKTVAEETASKLLRGARVSWGEF
jgi:hypothetical protein